MFVTLARSLLCSASLALLCQMPGLAAEPSGGTVSGAVTGPNDAPVPGARVTLDGPERLVTLSAADGTFSIADVAPGTYVAGANAAPYAAPPMVKLLVRAGDTARLDFSLSRARSLTTIGSVAAAANPALSTSSTARNTIAVGDAADQGATRISDVLQDDDSTTIVHAAGGGSSSLPTAVALRGSDPADTTVEIDGHQVNNGSTGDFDLSSLDPADFSSIDLIRGVAPSSFVAPNSIDGVIDIKTIEPTVDPHGLLRFSLGSFAQFGGTLQTTGTAGGRLGYALSLHRQGSDGQVNQSIYNVSSSKVEHVGSNSLDSSALGKLRYALGRAGAGFVEFSFRDQTSYRDLSAALSAYPGASSAASDIGSVPQVPAGIPILLGYGGTGLLSHDTGYGLDLSLPLGAYDPGANTSTTLLLRLYSSLADQAVSGPGAGTSPYLYSDRDLLSDGTLQLDHRFSKSDLTVQYEVRGEDLDTAFFEKDAYTEPPVAKGPAPSPRVPVPPGRVAPNAQDVQPLDLGQAQRTFVLRYTYAPSPALHLSAATYYSNLSLFGTHLDPRFGLVWQPDSRSALRVSMGTTYEAPALAQLVVPNPLPAVYGGYLTVGNPNLKPVGATEYGLGFDRVLFGGAHQTDVSADLYRVDLRTPISNLLPPLDPTCGPSVSPVDGTPCPVSYPVNAGDGVYRGLELSAVQHLGAYSTLRASYAVRSSFLNSIPLDFQNGSLLDGEQSLGFPLHKATFTFATTPPRGLIYGTTLVYEGAYNELNRPPFATLGGRLGYRLRNGFEIGLAGSNLTNVYDDKFTQTGQGVPYGGLHQTIATDAYALQGRAFAMTLTRRF